MKQQNVYFKKIVPLLSKINKTQAHNIAAAANLLYEQIKKDGLIHVFGVGGHSFIGSEEFFWRAGGLANVSPIFDFSLGLFGGGIKSTMLERLNGYGERVVQSRYLGPDDLLIITSLYGMNACTLDAAFTAKKAGCKVIGISSVEFAKNTPRNFPARHRSNKNLFEIADLHNDNHVPQTEGLVKLKNYPQVIGSASNTLQCFCINWLVIEAIKKCLDNGVEPPIWHSANIPGGDEKNRRHIEKYSRLVKSL
ncbi:MAG: sugar isomerase domain-containing protein [Fibrobacterota bacterium]